MRYLRCKCGEQVAWSSMGSPDCHGCSECGTTLSEHPNYHEPLQEHKWKTKYNQNTGKPFKVCSVCGDTDIESFKESGII